MKTLSRWMLTPVLLLSMAGLTGCGTAFPLATPDDAVADDALVGRWIWDGEAEDGTPSEMQVFKFDERAYFVVYQDGEDLMHFRAYITPVGGVPFVNLQAIDAVEAEDRLYLFFTYRLTDDGHLVITPVDGDETYDLEAFTSTEELYAFVAANVDDERLYGESGWFRRATE